jgi:(p)ppGpp synthase/HD superfamily hydrolase
MIDVEIVKGYSQKCYDDANCRYGDGNYFTHILMVVGFVEKYSGVFVYESDRIFTIHSAYTHDLIEDAKQTYSDIMTICGKDVADITLAVTDVHAENRLMRHLLTMHKTVKDHRAIILKLCDILANATYSRENGSSMYPKYVEEYPYRKAIFQKALAWYGNSLYRNELKLLWEELDSIHYNEKSIHV